MKTVLAGLCVGALVVVAVGEPAAELPGETWKSFFPTGVSIEAIEGLKKNEEAFAVRDAAGGAVGVVFRSDRVFPRVRGFGGELGVLVGVDRQGRIAGVKVLQHRETPRYFQKLKDGFYARFSGSAVDQGGRGIDTVTGATVSSRAVVEDVFKSARALLQNRGVQELLGLE